jgi:hypothetical protein
LSIKKAEEFFFEHCISEEDLFRCDRVSLKPHRREITELSGIRVIKNVDVLGLGGFPLESRRRRGKSSEWLAQLGIRFAVASHLCHFFFTIGYTVRVCLL